MQRESYSGHTFDVDSYGERKRNPYEGVALQTITAEEARLMRSDEEDEYSRRYDR
jgi:hypothetical protein